MEIGSCENKAHPKVVPKFTRRARVTLHLTSDLYLLRCTALQMTSHQIKSRRQQTSLTASPLRQVPGQKHSSRLTGAEEETDSGGFLNIYSHYVLPHSWQAVAGMAANVGLINRWRVGLGLTAPQMVTFFPACDEEKTQRGCNLTPNLPSGFWFFLSH